MMDDRMLHIESGIINGDGTAVVAALEIALAGARAGLVTLHDRGWLEVGEGALPVQLVGSRERTIPDETDMETMARWIVDAIDRPLASTASIGTVRAALGGVAAFVDAGQAHVMVHTATPWRTALACDCPCPMRGGRPSSRHLLETVERPIDPETAALIPDVVVAGMDGRHLMLRAYGWGGSRDPQAHGAGTANGFQGNAVPDAMTALRALEALRDARTRPRAHAAEDAAAAAAAHTDDGSAADAGDPTARGRTEA
jgi:hypothetical protein